METFPVCGLKEVSLEAQVTVCCPLGGRDRLQVRVTYQPRDLALEARSFRRWFAGRVAFAEQLASDLRAEIERVARPRWVLVEIQHGTERVQLRVRA